MTEQVNFTINAVDPEIFNQTLVENRQAIQDAYTRGLLERSKVRSCHVCFHADILDLVGEPFAWGATDCVCVTCLYIDQVYRTDIAKLALGHYTDERGALRRQRAIDPMDVLRSVGYEEHAPLPMRSGDVIVCAESYFVSLSFVWRDWIFSSDQTQGVFALPVSAFHKIDLEHMLCRRPHP